MHSGRCQTLQNQESHGRPCHAGPPCQARYRFPPKEPVCHHRTLQKSSGLSANECLVFKAPRKDWRGNETPAISDTPRRSVCNPETSPCLTAPRNHSTPKRIFSWHMRMAAPSLRSVLKRLGAQIRPACENARSNAAVDPGIASKSLANGVSKGNFA